MFGSVEGCALVWDRKKGAVVYGMEHEGGKAELFIYVIWFDVLLSDDLIQAVAVSAFAALLMILTCLLPSLVL